MLDTILSADPIKNCGGCEFYKSRTCSKHQVDTYEKELCGDFVALGKSAPKEHEFILAKTDGDKMLAFGWLYVSKTRDRVQVVDHSGDVVLKTEEIETASYNFVLKYRVAGDSHQKSNGDIIDVGRLVECVVFTPEKTRAMGIPDGVMPDGIWVGFKVDDPEVWEKVKSGEYKMFSLGGKAIPRLLEN